MPRHLPRQLAATTLPGEQNDRQREVSGGGGGQGVSLHPSVCPFIPSFLSLHPSFAFERTVPVKKSPRTWKQMSGAKSVSDRASSKAENYSDFERQHRLFFASRRLQVDSLYLIWRIEQENNYQLRSDKTCGVSRERDEKYSWCLQSLYPHAPLGAWADAMNEKLNLWQTRDVI